MKLRYFLGALAFCLGLSHCKPTNNQPCNNYCGDIIELEPIDYLSTERLLVFRVLLENQCSHNQLEKFLYLNPLDTTVPIPELGDMRCSTYYDEDRILNYYIW